MADRVFPFVGLPMALVLLTLAGIMLWDLVNAYGVAHPPDDLAKRSEIFEGLLNQARLGQRPSRGVMLWRLLLVTAIGVGMLVLWISEVT